MSGISGAGRGAPLLASRNFLTPSSVLRRIVGLSGPCKSDHVVEIGAGKGHLANQLIARCGRATAIGVDRGLYGKLSAKYAGNGSIRPICRDFLKWKPPETPYKVFASIPFGRATDIVRKLTAGRNMPEDAWPVMEKGAAKRFMGKPCETASSLLIRPFFNSRIEYYFRREGFRPAPSAQEGPTGYPRAAIPGVPPAPRAAPEGSGGNPPSADEEARFPPRSERRDFPATCFRARCGMFSGSAFSDAA